MIPLMFRYDPTLESTTAAAGEAGRNVAGGGDGNVPPPIAAASKSGAAVADAERNEQKAANMQAKLAVRALARM